MLLADQLGFTDDQRSNIGIVATEAATNALVHGKTAEMLMCPELGRGEARPLWLDLIALDSGVGIANVGQALEDGFSTQGTPGQGLGAIHRLADRTALYTIPDKGTALLTRFLLPAAPELTQPESRHPSFGAVSIPVRGETRCGDNFVTLPGTQRTVYMMVDGLGHGPLASEAAEAAVALTLEHASEAPAEILTLAHAALRSTRGAAMAVAVVDQTAMVVRYAGVGNITGTLTTGLQTRNMVSQNGTLGAVLPRAVQEYTYPFDPGTMLLMFSDGLGSRCGFTGYRGLATRHPELIAGVLYRDFTRRRDDATVLVARLAGERI